MTFEEHAAKPLLAATGIAAPDAAVAATPEQAVRAPCGWPG